MLNLDLVHADWRAKMLNQVFLTAVERGKAIIWRRALPAPPLLHGSRSFRVVQQISPECRVLTDNFL